MWLTSHTVPPHHTFYKEEDERSNFTVVEGGGIILPCNVEGDPRPTISWYKDGSPISLTDYHYFIREDGSLEIFSADPDDTAEYRCTASNEAGEIHKKVQLFVQGKNRQKKNLFKYIMENFSAMSNFQITKRNTRYIFEKVKMFEQIKHLRLIEIQHHSHHNVP